MIYLDYSATTPVDKRVLEAVLPYFSEKYGNSSSIHSAGREAKSAVDKARGQAADAMKCQPDEVLFTGSGSESDNLAILGFARASSEKGGRFLCSEIEHHAVIDAVEKTKDYGFETGLIPVNRDGLIDLDWLEKELKKGKVRFVSVMYANNEIGSIQPIKKVSELCREYSAVFHTDACQAAAYLSLDVDELGVDLMTINGSKVYGPKGVGALYVQKGIKLEPIVYGGGQENGLRSGTENVPGIVGLGKALEIAGKEREADSTRIEKLRDQLIGALTEIEDSRLNGSRENRLPNNANVSFLGIEGESLVLKLDSEGICVSTGSACSSKSLEASHVIKAIYKNEKKKFEYAHGSIRYSLGRFTKEEEIKKAASATKRFTAELRGISAIR